MPTGYSLTHDEFVRCVAEVNPNIEVLGTYTRLKDHIACRCRLDGYEWSPLAGTIIDGHGCPKCKGRNHAKSSRKTHEQFLQELQAVNPNIEVLGTYQTANTKIKCRCKIDGNEWMAKPSLLLSGRGCPVCGYRTVSRKGSISFDEFRERLNTVNPDVELLDEYQNCSTKMKCQCKICGYEWMTTGQRLLRGDGCAKCSGNAQLTQEEFERRMASVNPHITIIGKYTGRHTLVKCRCNDCDTEWESYPGNLYQGWGCPHCHMSRGERAIETYLINKGYDFQYNHSIDGCKSNKHLLFDFVLPKLRTVIEYDGEQHFRPVQFGGMGKEKAQKNFEISKRRDAIKNRFCADNDIRMIRVPYTDYDQIDNILDKLFA